jgi:DNA (cytosine-5)-methyltransferase 1
MMTFCDWFSGIGGFRLGFEAAGFKCLSWCEADRHAAASYQAMHGTEGEARFDDIRAVGVDDIPRADIWCGGFPCQDVSVAGKRRGMSGGRSGLFFELVRLLGSTPDAAKPRWLVLENVRGLLSVGGGFGFARVLLALAGLGYAVEWDVLRTEWFLPQHRERVFIVGRLGGNRGREIFPLGGGLRKADVIQGQQANTLKANYAKSIETGAYVAESGHPAQIMRADGGNPQAYRVYDPAGLCPTLDDPSSGGLKQPKIIQRGHGFNHGGCHDISPTLSSSSFEQNNFAGVYTNVSDRFSRGGLPGLSRTLKADGGHPAGVSDGYRIRKLTPKECFRLQGFPDGLFARAASVCSDTQLYKQAGNAVSVPVAREVALAIAGQETRHD